MVRINSRDSTCVMHLNIFHMKFTLNSCEFHFYSSIHLKTLPSCSQAAILSLPVLLLSSFILEKDLTFQLNKNYPRMSCAKFGGYCAGDLETKKTIENEI